MFNEVEWSQRIAALPNAQRRAFAAAVATRQVVSLERVAEKRFNIADRLWQGIGLDDTSNRGLWMRRIVLLPRLVPSCDAVKPCSHYVRQAMTSLGYAMLCRLSGSAHDALKAAACAINAAGLAGRHLADIRFQNTGHEKLGLDADELSQREVEHQASDLSYLAMGWLEEIRWSSYSEPLLTVNEANLLATAA